MGLFKKNKSITDNETTSQECNHKYQDFPWYIDASSGGNPNGRQYYRIKIFEPYVCIYCGKRIDKELWNISRYGSEREGDRIIDDLKEKFKGHIRHQAEVEDMINDMQLVDVEHLKYYHMLTGTDDPSTSRTQIDSPQLKL